MGKNGPFCSHLPKGTNRCGAISSADIRYFRGDGWTFGTAPIMTYNHESEEWMIPLNLTVGKTVTMNGQPWDFSEIAGFGLKISGFPFFPNIELEKILIKKGLTPYLNGFSMLANSVSI